MGATKPNHYSDNELQLSLVARALAHPARIRMVKLLREERMYRNIDLAPLMNLSLRSVKDHVDKLKDAGLIRIEYTPHYYLICLNENNMHRLSGFINYAA